MARSDDLPLLLAALPPGIEAELRARPDLDDLLEVVLDLGRLPEARFDGATVTLGTAAIEREDLSGVFARVGNFSADNRAGIERTLHRISAIRNRDADIIGLTCRVGRAVHGTVEILRDVIESGRSTLLVGRPGIGKTTLLREAARLLADEARRRVIVVDTSNEIAGDGDIPHPAIGRARRMQVPHPGQQHAVMIEAVENHMPEVIVIDEIGTEAEAAAARTIAERGVQLVATAHGHSLENLMSNPTLADLVGGIESVTLGDDEARRRGSRKTILERRQRPTFDVLVEIKERDTVAVHADVARVVDEKLAGRPPAPEIRTRTGEGAIVVEESRPVAPEAPRRRPRPLRIHPYAIGEERLARAIRATGASASVARSSKQADVVVAPRTYAHRQPAKLRDAIDRGIPVYLLRGQATRDLRAFVEDLAAGRTPRGAAFAPGTSAEREGARPNLGQLYEIAERAAAEVLARGEPIALPPSSAGDRRRQHELAERHGLFSASQGREPDRCVVLFPPPGDLAQPRDRPIEG